MSNEDCENCAGYRCPCTCTSDCGKKQNFPCPKSQGYGQWVKDHFNKEGEEVKLIGNQA